jgi:outer membrane protein assembly factor BamB
LFTDSLIDLGTDWSSPPPEPSRPRLGPVPSLALTAVLAVLLLAASAGPAPQFVAVATIVADGSATVALTPEVGLVAQHPAGGDPTISGYALPSGARRWTVTLSEPVDALELRPSGVLVAHTFNGPDSELTAGLDPATGRLLWPQVSASVVGSGPDRVLLLDSEYNGITGLRSVDLGTGRTVWSQPVSYDSRITVADGASGRTAPARVLVTARDGQTVEYDAGTGAVLLHGRLGVPSQYVDNPLSGAFLTIVALGDRVFAVYGTPRDQTISGYDLDTLTEQWRMPGLPNAYLNNCGPVLCESAENMLAAFDPATGATRWRSSVWSLASPLPGDRLIAYGLHGTGGRSIVDARTGHQLLAMGSWQLPDLAAQLFYRSGPERGVWIAAFSAERAQLLPVGFLPRARAETCRSAERYLACLTSTDKLLIGRYP